MKMIEEGMAGFKSKASQPFHTEVLEHIAELQRSDPSVRSALAEVGGLEELLSVIESGSEIRSSDSAQDKQLLLVEVLSKILASKFYRAQYLIGLQPGIVGRVIL